MGGPARRRLQVSGITYTRWQYEWHELSVDCLWCPTGTRAVCGKSQAMARPARCQKPPTRGVC